MLKRLDVWICLLAAIVISRLLTMAMIPLLDTTEARYGEIARIMAETNDWITPWFDYGVPFWGKPPLSFWLQALSFKLFGVTEFAARLPSWLANLGILALIYTLTLKLTGQRQAVIACLIFATMALSFMMSGAVLTDPFLALGTTLSLTGIILTLKQPESAWRWCFFIGLAIGLLAKGPLALILIGSPLALWLIWRRQWHHLLSIPWGRGLLLTALLSLPWYIAAELKTPGFINYFIIGEHFLRFIDAGWQGDLYGSAHKQAYGTIWLYWLWATLPWGPIALIILTWGWIKSKKLNPFTEQKPSDEQCLLLLAAVFPSLFFTFSGNILWTYQLPALAPFAVIAAMLPAISTPTARFSNVIASSSTALVPVLILLVGIYSYTHPDKFKTEKMLLASYNEHKNSTDLPLIYIDKPPFSARFYAKGKFTQMTLPELKTLLNNNPNSPYFLSIDNKKVGKIISSLSANTKIKLKNKRFTLLEVEHIGNTAKTPNN